MNSRRIESLAMYLRASPRTGSNHCKKANSRLASTALWRARFHLQQQRLGQWLQHRQFVNEGRIEKDVGVVLVGEDVQLLAAAHAGPPADGLGGGVAAAGGVAHDAAQEARVGGGHAVVLVQIKLRQRRDENRTSLPAGCP
jgi:hypothetical protein